MIANAITGGNREHIAGIVRAGALTPLSDMLTVMDCSVVVVVLKALAEILECGEYCKGSIPVFSNLVYLLLCFSS